MTLEEFADARKLYEQNHQDTEVEELFSKLSQEYIDVQKNDILSEIETACLFYECTPEVLSKRGYIVAVCKEAPFLRFGVLVQGTFVDWRTNEFNS
jgi:hypothetical protein